MTAWLKRILIGLVTIAIVALVGIAIFLLTFDPNAYKQKLQEIVYARYQRTLTIDGEIELSLFPRIGLALNDASLSQRGSDERFASVDSARVAVAIWPLLSNHFVIDHVSVSGFSAWLERSDQGQWNFHDLLDDASDATVAGAAVLQAAGAAVAAGTGSDAAAPTSTTEPAAPAAGGAVAQGQLQIDIAGLDLQKGAIHVVDKASGKALRVQNLDVKTGRITSDLPFDVAIKGRLLGDNPRADAAIEGQAQVQFSLPRKTYSAQKLTIQATGRLPGLDTRQAALRGSLGYSAYSRILNVSNLELALQGDLDAQQAIKGLNVTLSVPQLNLNQSQRELQLGRLALRAKGSLDDERAFDIAFDAPALSVSPQSASGEAVSGTVKLTGPDAYGIGFSLAGIGGNAANLTWREVKFEGAVKQADRLTRIDLTSPAAWDTVKQAGGLLAIKGDVRIDDTLLSGGGVTFPLIGSLAADLRKDQVQVDVNAVLEGSKLDFKLQTAALRSAPRSTFALEIDTLNLDTLLGPGAAADAPVKEASAEGAKAATPAPEPAPADAAPEAPPAPPEPGLSWLRDLRLEGTVKMGALRWQRFEASDIDIALKAADGRLDVSRLNAGLYGGTMKGAVSLAADAAVQMRMALDQIELEPFLLALTGRNRMSGQGSLSLDLSMAAAASPDPLSRLGGSAKLKVRDGAVKGFDAEQTLRDLSHAIRSSFQGSLPQASLRFDESRQTAFSALDATLALDKGVATVRSLNAATTFLRVRQGKPATIDLARQQLDLVLNVSVANVRGEGRELRALQGVAVPVRLHGAFHAPGYEVLWKQIASNVVQQAVRKGLVDALLDGAEHEPGIQALEAIVPAPAARKEAEGDALRSIGNALKGILR